MSDTVVESDSNMEVNNENAQPEFAQPNLTAAEIEKAEEAKLKAKYQFKSGPQIGGHSTFLQKKLAKGQKYFDSGDYQMAKQNSGGPGGKPFLGSKLVQLPGGYATGDAIPTPESVPARKTSIIQQKFTPLHPIPSTPTSGVNPPFVPPPQSSDITTTSSETSS